MQPDQRVRRGIAEAVSEAYRANPSAFSSTLTIDVPRTILDIQRLRTYASHLQSARRQKASAGKPPYLREAALLRHAKTARDSMRRLLSDHLINLQQLRQSDLIQGIAAKTKGQRLDAAEILQAAMMEPSVRAALDRSGFDVDLVSEALDEAKKNRVVIESTGDGFRPSAEAAGNVEWRVWEEKVWAGASTAIRIGDVYRMARFATIVEQFASHSLSGPLPLIPSKVDKNNGAPGAGPRVLDYFEAAAGGAVNLHAEFERHVRKLETVGLETYAGGAPVLVAIIVVLIVGIVTSLVGGLLIKICEDSRSPDDTLCDWGHALLGVGLLLAGGAVAGLGAYTEDVGFGIVGVTAAGGLVSAAYDSFSKISI